MYLTEDSIQSSLHWESLEALIRGISSIDLQGMPVQHREEAYQFIYHYGYDLNRQEDDEEVRAIMTAAIHFIETLFLENPLYNWEEEGQPSSPCQKVPNHITASCDVLDLLQYASQTDASPDRHWACAILKVMHTIAHIHNGPLYRYYDEAKRQILEGFDQILSPLNEDEVLLGKLGGRAIQLFGFETKDQKTRESILVKLLCKKEHVAEAIWDLVGVRLITQTPAEAVLALNILCDQKIIVFPNIIPSRSRNNLVDVNTFHQGYEAHLKALQNGEISRSEFESLVAHMPVLPSLLEKDFTAHNPSSSQQYRSIHITCRQLVRIHPPGEKEYRLFFPYEIQILDKESYLESKEGSSAHSSYKKKQLTSARRRVLGPLLGPTP
jgi:uncharacterized protein (TIGR04562 family)